MEPTREQRDIIRAEPEQGGTLLVSAFAGTGKTETLRMFAEQRPKSRILYLAFNRAIAREANRKFADLPRVEARTVHSLAFAYKGGQYRHRLGNLRVYDLRDMNIAYSLYRAGQIREAFQKYLNSAAQDPWELSYDVAGSAEKRRVLQGVSRLWELCINPDAEVTVPHDVYLKLFQISGLVLPYDYILVDEAQDLTDCIIDLVRRQPARKVFVGDSHQQIYGWKGAVDSLMKLEEEARHLFLTQSFRCPEHAARKANQYLWLLGSPKPIRGLSRARATNRQRAYIARTNALVFDTAANLDLKRHRVHFLGGFDSYHFQAIVDARKLLNNSPGKLQDPFMRRFGSATDFEEYVDEAGELDLKTRLEIAKKHPRAEELYRSLRDNCVASQQDADIVVTTAHKAKGQEFGCVAIMGDFLDLGDVLFQAGSAKKVRVPREELNLLYVAITRTQDRLHLDRKYILDRDILTRIAKLMREGRIELC
jgi:superfamily I DNA/RNA helicase